MRITKKIYQNVNLWRKKCFKICRISNINYNFFLWLIRKWVRNLKISMKYTIRQKNVKLHPISLKSYRHLSAVMFTKQINTWFLNVFQESSTSPHYTHSNKTKPWVLSFPLFYSLFTFSPRTRQKGRYKHVAGFFYNCVVASLSLSRLFKEFSSLQ